MKKTIHKPLVGETWWMFLAYAAKLVLQAIYFVFLTKKLGANGIGAFAASLALINLVSAFVDFGAYSLIVKDVSEKIETSRAVGNSLLQTMIALPLGVSIVFVMKFLLLPNVSWNILVPLTFATLVGGRFYGIASGANVANRLLRRNAVFEVINGLSLVLMVNVLGGLGGGITTWSILILIQNVILGCVSLLWVFKTWGPPSWSYHEAKKRVLTGLHFALGNAAKSAYTDLDKAMLARFSTLNVAGIYGTATRVISVAFLPMSAFLGVMYPRFFQAGRHGINQARELALKILPLTIAYGIIASIGIWVVSPWFTSFLGQGFSDTTPALRLLSGIIILQCIQYPFADAYSGSGFQKIRNYYQLGALATNLVLNVLLIPGYGWEGATWATIGSQSVLTILLMLSPDKISLRLFRKLERGK